MDGGGLPNVQGLAFGKILSDIQKNDFVGQLAVGNGIGTGGTYISGSDNGNFHGLGG